MVGFGENSPMFVKGEHASTFGGGYQACNVARAVLNTIESDHLLDGRKDLENIFRDYDFNSKSVVDRRGLGFVYGVQLDPRISAIDVVKECEKNGVFIGTAGNNTVRLEPPLIVTPEQFELGLFTIAQALKELEKTL